MFVLIILIYAYIYIALKNEYDIDATWNLIYMCKKDFDQ